MAPQHVEIAETIAALRKKLRKDRQAQPSQPASVATNRGNKLAPGAQYVHAGSLAWRTGPSSGNRAYYTEKINHAGFDREILARNPRRLNEHGDEMADHDSDIEAETDTEQVNPYADVHLEEILRPLTQPSDLAHHPALSAAYTDPALSDMVTSTEAKIREERNNLWRAKNLYRYFTGDENWIPCGKVESESDWDLFGPHPGFSGVMRKRRKLSGDLTNGASPHHEDHSTPTQENDDDQDVTMAEVEVDAEGLVKEEEEDEHRNQDHDATVVNGIGDPHERIVNGTHSNHHEDQDADEGQVERDVAQDSTASSPAPSPPRRITRALAAEAETQSQQQNPSPPPTSPSPSLSSPPASPSNFEPDPLFLLPSDLAARHAPHPAYFPLSFDLAHAGLPPEELRETRKLLGMFIQKSEETIRGLENILAKLIKAKRRRDKLHAWCIAEGHLGDMSDGEDWIDEAYWGLEPHELKKGRDEDGGAVVAVESHPPADNDADVNAAAAGLVMGRSKNKRRRAAAAKD